MRATERESVQKRIIHTRRFFLGFFPGPQTEPSHPAHKRPSLSLSGRPKGHEGIGGREGGEDGQRRSRGGRDGRSLALHRKTEGEMRGPLRDMTFKKEGDERIALQE